MNESSFTRLFKCPKSPSTAEISRLWEENKGGEIDEDFYQWLMRIIADDEIYEDKERALAFELAAAEHSGST